MAEMDYFTCKQCGNTTAVVEKSMRMLAGCSNGHQWFRCEHGTRCEGHYRVPCLCHKYKQKKAKQEEKERKFYIQRKQDRNPSKKAPK